MKLIDQWLEVFRAGDYGDKGSYTTSQLDELVTNYNPAEHEAPVVIGHPKDNGPAWGWVESLKRIGDTLFAKLKQVHPEFEKMVQDGMFKKRSISLYTEPKLMFRHLGFLGAMPPEVKGLADPVFRDGKYADIPFEEDSTMEPKDFIDALKSVFGRGQAGEPKLFTEAEVKKAADDAAAAAQKPLLDSITRLEKTVNEFVEKTTKEHAAQKFSASVEKAIDRLKATQKWIPAYEKMGIPHLFEELAASSKTVKFGEAGKETEKPVLELLADFLEALPSFVQTKEIARSAAAASRGGNLVQFNDPKASDRTFIDLDSHALAEAAQEYANKNKVSYGEALTVVRRESRNAKEGSAAANAV